MAGEAGRVDRKGGGRGGEMATGRGRWGGGNGEGETEGRGAKGRGRRRGKRKGDFTDGLMPDRMHGVTEAMAFIDSYKLKHMECLGGMRLQSFLNLFACATPGAPASSVLFVTPIFTGDYIVWGTYTL